MKGFVGNIEKLTEGNDDFRRVLYTGHNIQLVLMAIQPGSEIGEEVHDDIDQFFRIETGEGEVWIDGVAHPVKSDDGIIVPQGARHNVVNTGKDTLRLYTLSVRPNILTERYISPVQMHWPPTNISTAAQPNSREPQSAIPARQGGRRRGGGDRGRE